MGENLKRAKVGALGLLAVSVMIAGLYSYAQLGYQHVKTIAHGVMPEQPALASVQ